MEDKYNFTSIDDILDYYKTGLQIGDNEADNLIEAIVEMTKLGSIFEEFKSCEYLKNIANFSLHSMCDAGIRNYYYSHFGLILAFLGFILQFLGNYYGEIYIELNIFQVKNKINQFLIQFII